MCLVDHERDAGIVTVGARRIRRERTGVAFEVDVLEARAVEVDVLVGIGTGTVGIGRPSILKELAVFENLLIMELPGRVEQQH